MYLGLPLGCNPRDKAIWDPVVSWVRSRLAGWKRRSLSFAARVKLVISVLSSLPVYYMGDFVVSRGVIAKIDKIRRGFLWGGVDLQRKMARVCWDVVCRPRSVGALGVVDLRVRNLALLSKKAWRYATCSSSLWRRLIVAKYGEGVPWWRFNVVRSHSMSPIWKGIVAYVSCPKVGRYLEPTNFFWKVGHGERVLFWVDPLCVADPLKDLFPRLFSLALEPLAWVVDYARDGHFLHSEWLLLFRRDLCSFELRMLSELRSLVLPIVLSDVEDSLVWKSDVSGAFSVRVLTNCLMLDRVGEDVVGVCFIWKLLVPPKVRVDDRFGDILESAWWSCPLFCGLFSGGNQFCGSGKGARVDANQYGKDVIILKNLVKELYADPETRPKVLGPCCFYDEKWLNTFLEVSGREIVDGVTHHIYSLVAGGDPNLMSKILDPLYLSQVSQTYKVVLNVVNKFRPQSGTWVSESGGAFNSGSKDVSPTFVDGFFMGIAATYDQKVFCRQVLIGGNYGLLNATTFIPNPDYYGALLWHRLMGSTVHAVTKESDPDLRVYVHCVKKKPGVSVIFINLSKDISFNITLSNLKSEDDGKPNYEFVGKQNREEYHLTSLFGKMKGGILSLNDVPMVQPGSRDIPAMDPRLVDASAPIYVAAQPIAYVTIRNFEAPACV
ncbi:hypothetical protein GQ457_11G024950 [Hibiscus cannabinus]